LRLGLRLVAPAAFMRLAMVFVLKSSVTNCIAFAPARPWLSKLSVLPGADPEG
jgi:hypothetical protein